MDHPTSYVVSLLVVHIGLAAVATGHALLNKRDPRSAVGWIAFCIAYPYVGPLAYGLFGVNRIRTRARALVAEGEDRPPEPAASVCGVGEPAFAILDRIAAAVTHKPLLAGNDVRTLHNGEQAYPPMLAAIDGARTSIYLSTYIFESNRTGRAFIDALSRAHARGVRVRALVDGVGELYSFPRASVLLRKAGVPTARFLPPSLIPPSFYVNLRNHRKLLVVDGEVAFLGGMNIGDRHLIDASQGSGRVIDIHFEIRGPAVFQIERAFLDDWHFAAGERLRATEHEGAWPTCGEMRCRLICDGPNEDHDKLPAVINAAIAAATDRVVIVTPYFIPGPELMAVLQAAALRGVDVTIVLPATNNLPFVHWATQHCLDALLGRGVKVWMQQGPFVHSKLFVVDHHYVQVGSANMDPRSLNLNFEVALEIYDSTFARSIEAHIGEAIERSRAVTLQSLSERSLAVRLRDATAWLASPYL